MNLIDLKSQVREGYDSLENSSNTHFWSTLKHPVIPYYDRIKDQIFADMKSTYPEE